MVKDMEKSIVEHIQRYYGNRANVEVNRETNFDELGIDSLDRTELVLHIEREFEITIPDEKWDECVTVGLMIDAAKKAALA